MTFSPADTDFRRLARLATVACVAIPLLAACGGGGSGSSSTLNLGITDTPVNSASSVVVDFTGVQLQPSGGGKAITFTFDNSIDLLKQQGGNEAALLSGVSVPAGNYNWIRLIVSKASITTSTGNTYPLTIPSSAQTGLKLVQGFTMAVGQQANFTIDFMLQQSITSQTTSSGTQYILRPALRLVNNEQVGTISGSVVTASLQSNTGCLTGANAGTGPLPNANVYIFSGTQTLPSLTLPAPLSSLPTPLVEPEIMESSSGYSYKQAFLPTGKYTLAVVCTSTSNGTTSVESYFPNGGMDATVSANQTATVNLQ